MGIIPSHHVLGGTPVLFPNAQRILYVIALSNIEEYSTIADLNRVLIAGLQGGALW